MQNIPNNALLRLPQVLALIPVSRSAWWAGCKSGRYPKPVKLGPRTTAWRHRILPRFWKSSQPKRRKNEPRFFPGSSSVTPARVPEASFGQGHALSGRFAGLDRMTLLSGYGCLRATDEEAPAGALSKEVRRPEAQRQQYKKLVLAYHVFPAYRHAGITILARPPRLALRRVLLIHTL